MRLARWTINAAAAIVPSDRRTEWRREWHAELDALNRGRSPLGFALGAPRHALSLRAEAFSPTVVAADLRFAWRVLRRRPGFASAAVVTLAIGIGATTAIFSVVYGILLKPLPYRDPANLVQLWEVNPLFNWTEAEVAPANVVDWRERNVVFSDVAWYLAGAGRQVQTADLTLGGDDPMRVKALQVSPNFFDVLGVAAQAGRTFAAGEDIPGSHRVVVLSDTFWRARFGARSDILGKTVTLNAREWMVIGIAPAAFSFDRRDIDCYIPLAMTLANARATRQAHILRAVARLKPGVSLEQAQTNITSIARDLEHEYPKTNRQMSAGVGPLDDWFVGQTRRPLVFFMAAVALLLLIACANVANLVIVRTAERVRELGLRSALGASRGRLVRQLVWESFAIACAGTAGGVAIAWAAIRLFVANAPATLPRVDAIAISPAVLGFAIGVSCLTTMIVGVIPAIQAAAPDVRTILGDGGRGVSARGRLTRAVVAIEVALAVVLLTSAAITIRSFRSIVTVDPGFRVEGLVTARVTLPATRYSDDGKATAFFDALTSRLRAQPGVVSAGAATGVPTDSILWSGDLFIESQPDVHGRDLHHRTATPGYLETIGLPLHAGRFIDATDRADGQRVVVINATLARRYFVGRNPIGQRIAFDPPSATVKWRTIVGVAGDEPQEGLTSPIAPEVFEAETQQETGSMAIVVRSDLPVASIIDVMRGSVRAVDPQLALVDARPLSDLIGRTFEIQRLAVWITTAFGGVGLLLSAVGIYGVVAYAAATRTREVGVRMACGASAGQILRLMIAQHLRVVTVGLALGVLVSALVTTILAASLYGVPKHDVLSLVVGAAVLLGAAAVACAIPARRAMRVDPVQALRAD